MTMLFVMMHLLVDVVQSARSAVLSLHNVVLVAVFVAACSAAECDVHFDSTDPIHGLIRSGADMSCEPVIGRDDCVARCCGTDGCNAFSYNFPWTLNISYMGCIHGKDCCCLKASAPDSTLKKNSYPMNITTGTVNRTFVCSSDADCSLNGCSSCICQKNGSCTCDHEWTGDQCTTLNLVPPDTLEPAYPPAEWVDNTTSWGGSVVLNPKDGLYHMFVAEMSNNCGMTTWSTNSIIRHAVSTSPVGPFTREETILPQFAHNPTAIRAPDGTFLLYHIGCGNGRPGFPPCTNCAQGKTISCSGPGEQNGCTRNTTNILYSQSLDGPWEQLNAEFINSPTMTWPGFDNPTVTFFANGSLLGLSRGGNPAGEAQSDGVVTAPSWKGPYTMHSVVGSPQSPAVEDPFIYQDHRGNFHALFHKFTDEVPGCGGHAYSKDGYNWTLTNVPAYTTNILLADGSVHAFNRRERPHLLFDESGTRPIVLYTSLTNWSTSGANKGHDNAFTFAQRIVAP